MTITVTPIALVIPAALAAQGTYPTLSASNCTAVQAVSNPAPAPFADADMQQANELLAAVDPGAYAIFKKLPAVFAWWMRGNYGTANVSMGSLTIAVHEANHSVQQVNNFQCTSAGGYKYLLNGTLHTTNLLPSTTAAYSLVSTTYPLATKPPRYNTYIAATPFPSGNDARILLDELNAYSTAARLAINMMGSPEYGNFTTHQDGDLAGMVDFMLFVQSYAKAARLGNPTTYAALQSANTKAYIQTLWNFAEQTLTLSIPFAYSADSAAYVAGKPMFVNAQVLAKVYSAEWLAELDSLGITHKTASDFSGTLIP